MATITKEEARRRWNNVFRQKRETTQRMIDEMVEEFVSETGKAPKYKEVW